MNQVSSQVVFVELVQVEITQFVVADLVGKHVIDGHQDLMGHRHRAEVEDRAIPGHWEGDLLRGTRNTHIATLVERHSRFVMLIKIPSRDTAAVVGALSKHVRKLPATLRRSLTWDRGAQNPLAIEEKEPRLTVSA